MDTCQAGVSNLNQTQHTSPSSGYKVRISADRVGEIILPERKKRRLGGPIFGITSAYVLLFEITGLEGKVIEEEYHQNWQEHLEINDSYWEITFIHESDAIEFKLTWC